MSVIVVTGFAALFVLIVMILRSRQGETITMPPDSGMSPPPRTVEALVRAGRKIEAIKLLREQTGLGLKEAKDQVDELFDRR
jgi:large subunit ribosomal protein L7/L12